MHAASLRYAAATPQYLDLQLEFHVPCRLRAEMEGPQDRVFAFRFVRCWGIFVACRQWDPALRLMKFSNVPLIEALHMDALHPLTLDYFLMKSASEIRDITPHMEMGRWLRGTFEGFEAALERGSPCFWLKAGGTGPQQSALDCCIILACDEYRILNFKREMAPDEFIAIGDRWRRAWREYWDRRTRGEIARNGEFEWTRPYEEQERA